jgi:hypothetical protein
MVIEKVELPCTHSTKSQVNVIYAHLPDRINAKLKRHAARANRFWYILHSQLNDSWIGLGISSISFSVL